MKKPIRILIPIFLAAAAFRLWAQAPSSQDQPCPMHATHSDSHDHHAMVENHGDQAMGFSHDKTTHHFLLSDTGGSINVTANDPNDSASIQAIRMHLEHIAAAFAGGDYSTPMFVHDGVPPGVTSMKILKDQIRFRYESIEAGARVAIASDNPLALAAIHDFLQFQITDHRTGDPLKVQAAK
jgi:hypothetical protein